MLFDRTINILSASLVCGGFLAGLSVAAAVPACATDIEWRTVSLLEPVVPGYDYTRHAVATFSTGELAAGVVNGNLGPIDGGRQTARIVATYRFDDGSTISTRFDGSWDLTTGA